MPYVSAERPVCTVVVTVDTTRDVMDELVEHARLGLDRFPDCGGFTGGALHVSDDGTRLVQYLQWESEVEVATARGQGNQRAPSNGTVRDLRRG